MDRSAEKMRRRVGLFRCWVIVLSLACLALIVALASVLVINHRQLLQLKQQQSASSPCPGKQAAAVGGLVTSGDPENPSPFHDITAAEHKRLYEFLRNQTDLNLAAPDRAAVNTSNIFIVDLFVPSKKQVLRHLDQKEKQPDREAHVIVFRGDKPDPVVEEYRVGPLSRPAYANKIVNSQRRNPVQFSLRPVGGLEFSTVLKYLMATVDEKIGTLLTQSYGGKFTDCGDQCLTIYPTPMGTALHGDINKRKIWFWGNYPVEYYTLYPLDFGVLAAMDGSDPSHWTVEKVWYSGALYDSLDDLASKYANDASVHKTKISYVRNSKSLKSVQALRGKPVPDPPKRPPVQVEPDGKRYTIEHRHVTYLHWAFDIRLSALTGPQVYDVRFQDQRLVYELGLAEIAVFYSGHNPVQQVTDFVDSGALIGTHSKSLIPGGDCPVGATFLDASFLGEAMAEPTKLQRAVCVFEQNAGVPLRRHLSYSREQGAFYGGMEDSVLVVRSILTIINYDYIVDFVFHQNGAINARVISTGYILSTFYSDKEEPFGFKLDENINGNIHHHMFHFKADLDVAGTNNRFETLDITSQDDPLPQISPSAVYNQIRYQRSLKKTELESVYHYNFSTPKYLLVHNNNQQTQYNAPRAFRIMPSGMSPQLLKLNNNNEGSIPWARQQVAVTVQKDDERVSSSPYAMFDSQDPVTSFQRFLADNESIVDQDLVFWITLGTHHIPHTEDIPVTPTVGGHLGFFLLPYNYFPECPSVSSRDNIRVEYATPNKPENGLTVDRNGNKAESVCGALTLEDIVRERPDDIIQTHRDFKLL